MYSCLPSTVSIRIGSTPRSESRTAPPACRPADVAGELEAVGHQLRADERRELVRPLVEVHRACRQPGCSLPAGRRRAGCSVLSGRAVVGEEAERVEVGARDPVRLDDVVGAGRPEPQRTSACRTSSAEAGRPSPTRAGRSSRSSAGATAVATSSRRRRLQQPRLAGDVIRRHAANRRPRRRTPCASAKSPVAGQRSCRIPGASDAGRWAERVVGEEEVLDRVRVTAAAPLQVRARPRRRRVLVAPTAGAPRPTSGSVKPWSECSPQPEGSHACGPAAAGRLVR